PPYPAPSLALSLRSHFATPATRKRPFSALRQRYGVGRSYAAPSPPPRCLLPLLLHLPDFCPAGIDEVADAPLPAVEDDEVGALALHELVQGFVGVVALEAGGQFIDVLLVKLQHVVGRDLVET